MSPRDADNPTIMHTFGGGYYSPEDVTQKGCHDSIFPREYDAYGTWREVDFDLRRARKYAALDPEILMVRGLDRRIGGTLILSDDDETAGYIAITRKSWQTCMGDTPLEGLTLPSGRKVPSAEEVIAQDLEAYNQYVQGECVAFVVEERVRWQRVGPNEQFRHTWETVESAGGFYDVDEALREAEAVLPDGLTKTA